MSFIRSSNRIGRISTAGVMLALAIAFSLMVSLANFSMVSSATITVKPVRVPDGQLPTTDPNSDMWSSKALAVEVPLSAQQMVRPSGGSVRAVYVRALDDSKTLALMVSWADDTMNTVENEQESSDAVALAWPLAVETSAPFQCMGQLDAPVNIWQWKASEQVAVETTHSGRSPVFNLVSNGICKAADVQGLTPTGKGVWGNIVTAEGQTIKGWNVVFARDYNGGSSGTAEIVPGKTTNVAFAVWNGAPGLREMKSRKAVASWVTFNSDAANRPDLTWLNLLIIILVSAIVIGVALALVPKQTRAPAPVATPAMDITGRPLADTPAGRAMAITARSRRL
jgi:DMSO reductase family type II enzyme heme b subunit